MKKKIAGAKDRVIGSGKVSTIIGTVLGSAIAGAANYYQTSGGNIGSWQPYAIAGGVAVAGALLKGKTE